MNAQRFTDTCLDVGDASRIGPFRAEVLGLTRHPRVGGEGRPTGPTSQHTIWANPVPEPATVKNRVHLDVHAESLEDLTALGARVLLPAGDDRRWTVMADLLARAGGPETNEFCVFEPTESLS